MTVNKLAYTINEAVEATGIGRKSILSAIRAGHLKAVRVGAKSGKWIVSTTSLVNWLDSLPKDEA